MKSIKKNGGFYVGRYESSVDENNKVQSKAGFIPIPGGTVGNQLWNGLYKKLKTYSTETLQNNTVKTSMITGSAYDAMLNWIVNSGAGYNISSYDNIFLKTTSQISSATSIQNAGANENDKMNNIYDLIGNVFEWTTHSSNYSFDNQSPNATVYYYYMGGCWYQNANCYTRIAGSYNPEYRSGEYIYMYGARMLLYL